jgi:hypothetical protein
MMSNAPEGADTWLLEQKQSHAAGNNEAADNKTVKDFELLPPFLTSDGDDWSGGGGGWEPL